MTYLLFALWAFAVALAAAFGWNATQMMLLAFAVAFVIFIGSRIRIWVEQPIYRQWTEAEIEARNREHLRR